tara:strand:- start:579 stop:881 length:303 start_codon:yes stop_codon:yes gene_type:complete
MRNIRLIMFFLLVVFCVGMQGCVPKFFKVIPNNFAKEVCSCIFVEGQNKNYCKEYGRQMLDVSGYKILEAEKEVLAWGFSFTAKAVYDGPQYGCRLLPDQ